MLLTVLPLSVKPEDVVTRAPEYRPEDILAYTYFFTGHMRELSPQIVRPIKS